MPTYSGTWSRLAPSIFTTMSQEAAKAQAINLSQGFPNFDGPDEAKADAIAAIQAGKNQYAPAMGLMELREAIVQREKERRGLSFDASEETTVFSGATEALFCAIVALCEPGDELIVFEPFYDSYLGSALAARAEVKPVRLHAPDWHFSEAELERAISPRSKAILVNTPHNPTGKVFTRSELELISAFAKKHDLFVIADEVYEELVFAPAEHISLVSFPGMRERTVTISSSSKTFSFTGWKVGYAFAIPELSRALRNLHQFVVFCSATPLQAGLVRAFHLPHSYYEAYRREYRERRDTLVAALTQAGFSCFVPEGTYFVIADFNRLSSQRDIDFAIQLTRECKVASIPLSLFYKEPAKAPQTLLRFAFCKDLQTLRAAGENLLNFEKGT